MNVQNMTGKNGRAIPNQFEVIDSEGREWFQSYKSMIAVKGLDGIVSLDSEYWNYSNTTSKYRNQFLGMTTKEVKEGIKNGNILLTNLNG